MTNWCITNNVAKCVWTTEMHSLVLSAALRLDDNVFSRREVEYIACTTASIHADYVPEAGSKKMVDSAYFSTRQLYSKCPCAKSVTVTTRSHDRLAVKLFAVEGVRVLGSIVSHNKCGSMVSFF